MRLPSLKSQSWLHLLQRYQGLVGLFLLFAVAFLLEKNFFTGDNWSNILNQLAIPGALAIGMTFVILTGGIDLSVGSHLALLNCIIATWCVGHKPLGMTIGFVLVLGAAIGGLLGYIVSSMKMQPFVVTLAAMVTLRGISYVYTNNANISGLGDVLDGFQKTVAGLPVPAWILIVLTILTTIVLWKTSFGRSIYAIGGNEQAARMSGVPVTRTRVAAYAVNGLCVALAAILFTSRTNNGQPSAASGYELDAIAAAVVGGCSLIGGYGNALGTFLGALFIGSLNDLLILRGVNDFVGMGWKGIIILIAVYLQNIGRK